MLVGRRRWYQKMKIKIPFAILGFLLVARLILQPLLLKEINKFLATFSPTLEFHVNDLDISFIRGSYSFDEVNGRVKGAGRKFVTIETVDVSVAWRELFKGRVLTDISVEGLDFSLTKSLQDALAKTPKKEEAREVKDTLFPVKVERLDVKNSTVTLDDYPSLEEGKKFQLSNIDGRISNLTPREGFPLSFFNLNGTLFGNADIKTSGHLNTLSTPLKWDVDTELRDFDLRSANEFLKSKLPLTFTKGNLDVYAEVKSENGQIEGYVKPFLKNIDVIKGGERFTGPKHWFIEILAALGNLVLRTSDTKSVATRIPFSMDEKGFHIEKGEALSKAIEHGFERKLSPGVEDALELK